MFSICMIYYLHISPAKNHGPGAMPGASPSDCATPLFAAGTAARNTARKQCRTGDVG